MEPIGNFYYDSGSLYNERAGLKINEIINRLNSLTAEPEMTGHKVAYGQATTIFPEGALTPVGKMIREKIEGQIEGLLKVMDICRTDGMDIFGNGHYENINYKDGYIKANQHFYKLIREEITRLEYQLTLKGE
jgi:hypothetical protein